MGWDGMGRAGISLRQTSQGQFGVKSEIFGEHSSPVLGGSGGMPPREIFEILVQNGAIWRILRTYIHVFISRYITVMLTHTYTRADRRSIGRAANWIYSPTVECVWFTNRCVRAWHDRWMRESHAQCVRLVRSASCMSIHEKPTNSSFHKWFRWIAVCLRSLQGQMFKTVFRNA